MGRENIGNVTALPDGRFRVRMFLGKDPVTDRFRYRTKIVSGTRKQAEKLRDSMRAERDCGTYTVKDLANEWFVRVADQKVLRGKMRAITRDEYVAVVKKLFKLAPGFEKRQLTTIDARSIRELYDSIGKRAPGGGAGYVRYLHNILRQMFAYAMRDKLVLADPISHIQAPSPTTRRPARALSDQETARLVPELRAFEHTGGLMLELALWLALRPSEAIGIRIDAIDWERGVLNVQQRIRRSRRKGAGGFNVDGPKTAGSVRSIPIPPSLMPRLEAQRRWVGKKRLRSAKWEQEWGLLFPAARCGRPHDAGNVQRRVLDTAAARAGIGKITLYGLRHSGATRFAREKHSIPELIATIGHVGPKLLQIYLHGETSWNIANASDEKIRAIDAKIAGRDRQASNA